MMIPYKNIRARENLFCGECNAFIGEGDMYLFDEERAGSGEADAVLCHFCNYKRKKKSPSQENETKSAEASKTFKEKVNRLDELVARATGDKSKDRS